MRWKLVLSGSEYSSNKEKFKKILKDNSLKWKGTLAKAVWASSSEKVRAVFKRDEMRDITIEAVLFIEIEDNNDKKDTNDAKTTTEAQPKLFTDLSAWAKTMGKEWLDESAMEKQAQPMGKSGYSEEASESPEVRSKLAFWDMFNKPQEAQMRKKGCPESFIQRALEDWRAEREKMKMQFISEA